MATKVNLAMSFLTAEGRTFTIKLADADLPKYTADPAKYDTDVKAAQAAIIAAQPFTVTLEAPAGWKLTQITDYSAD